MNSLPAGLGFDLSMAAYVLYTSGTEDSDP